MNKSLSLFLPAALMLAFSSSAKTIDFTYNVDREEPKGYGYGTLEPYYVAIRIDNPQLVGKQITGIRFSIPETGGRINPQVSAWVAPGLPEGAPEEDSMLAFQNSVMDGNTASISFPVPVQIPAEGVYAGYSLTVEELTSLSRRFPLNIATGDTPGGLYVFTPSRNKWTDAAIVSEKISTMVVTIEGEFPEVSAAVTVEEGQLVSNRSEGSFRADITNYGLQPIKELTYSVGIGDKTSEHTVKLSEEIPALFGAHSFISLPAGTPDKTDYTPLTMDITTVNGLPNQSPYKTAETFVILSPVIPVNRPLVEEYTGLWCGSCPSGYVALEQGNYYYGDEFVAIAYHVNDALQTKVPQPSQPGGLPAVYINRSKLAGPDVTLDKWNEIRPEQVPADIAVQIEWTDASRSALRARSRLTFINGAVNVKYSIGYILVADKLNNAAWGQANYYSGQMNSGPFWDIFNQGGGYVYGLDFNNVPLLSTPVRGVDGSLPSNIRPFVDYQHEYTFELSEADRTLLQDPSNLRVIAVLVNSSNIISVNSVSSDYSRNAPVAQSVDRVEDDSPVIALDYFDLMGRPLKEAPEKGPYIRLVTRQNGSRSSSIIMSR